MIPRVPGHRIIRPIGSGNMGMVYLAEQEALGRQVALKVLYPHHARNRERRERFFNEARLMANLIHPNIVQLFSLVEAQGDVVIVMEYVHGRNMDTMIGSEVGPITYEKALPLITDMLRGLGYAHSSGIVHRDIKPGNVMVSSEHVAKVTDFGVAKLIGQRGMTRAGVQVGTLAYMSPEQVLGKDVDQRADVYSLGVTLYEMLAGRLPLDGHDVGDLEYSNMILNERMPDPREFYPHIPEWLVAVVFKAIEKKPEKRFASCEEFRGQVEMGLSTGSVSVALNKPFFSRMSSGIRRLFSHDKIEVPVYFGEGSGSGSGTSSRYLGETADERRERKKQQLRELMDKGREAALGEVQFAEESSLEDENIGDIPDAAAGEDRLSGDGVEDDHQVHTPDDLSRSREEMLEEAGDPIDDENEPSGFARLFSSTLNRVAGVAVAVVIAVFTYFAVASRKSEADDLATVPVELTPFHPSVRVVERLETAGVLFGELNGAAVSQDGSVAFATDGDLHVLDTGLSEWMSIGVSDKQLDISWMPDGHLAYSEFNSGQSPKLFITDNLSETDRLNFDLAAPFNLRWFADSSFCGVIPVHNSGESAGYAICRFDDSGEVSTMFHEYLHDISDYSIWSIPNRIKYSIYYDYPIAAFSSAGDAYITYSSGDRYLISCFSSSGSLTESITREVTSVSKTQQELDAERALYTERMNGSDPPDGWPYDHNRSCIRWMGCDGQDRLWVLRGNTAETQFDLFNSQGELVAELSTDLPPDGEPWSFDISGSQILAYRSDGSAVEAYRLELVDRHRAYELVTAWLHGEYRI